MPIRILCCLLLLLTVSGPWLAAQPVTVSKDCEISWTRPTTNKDGSPLEDLFQFWLYAKTDAAQPYPAVPLGKLPVTMTKTTCQAANLKGPRYFLMMRAVDSAGNLADPSNEIELVTDGNVPGAVTNLKAIVTTTATIESQP